MRFQMSSREQLAVDMSEAGQSSKARRVCVVCVLWPRVLYLPEMDWKVT